MTPEMIEQEWLSLRYWSLRCVLPTALILLALLGLFHVMIDTTKELDEGSVIVGFFALYFVLVKGGHIIMIRSLHFELKKKFEEGYRERLAKYTRTTFRKRNLGFTLAQIKRELLTAETKRRDQFKR
ncbi:hypothetical protein ACJ3XI_07965 [Litorimonas sp. RW-G-Af-16]|uniref:hypothetical protein n=1 Tax=Litorimonas sp. RW-G-Af-16 TaxID=3241168 RepID=UPI00390CD546